LALAAALTAPAPSAASSDVIELPPIEIRASRPLVPATYRDTPVPPYPAAAREQGLQGVVILTVRVGADGRVADVRIKSSSGARILDDSAVSAVKTWTFTPARQGSRTVESWVDVPVRFALTER
jgi:protein TonB